MFHNKNIKHKLRIFIMYKHSKMLSTGKDIKDTLMVKHISHYFFTTFFLTSSCFDFDCRMLTINSLNLFQISNFFSAIFN